MLRVMTLAVAAGLALAQPDTLGTPRTTVNGATGAGADSTGGGAYTAAPVPVVPPVGRLVVTAVGVRPDQGGRLVFTLFRGPAGWLEAERAVARREVPVAAGEADSVTVAFDDVPCDSSYAVQVLHDRNGDGRLNMRTFPFPKPKEGAGVANNHTRMGPPRYDKASFALWPEGVALRVVMRY